MTRNKIKPESVTIQLALDLDSVEEAIATAKAVESQVDLVEVGTPLIKRYGVNAISKVSRQLKKPVVADMKTMDGGSYEARIAFDAGADYVVVMGMADQATIENVANEAQKYKKGIVVDFLGIVQPRQKILFINSLNQDVILLSHLAFDNEFEDRDKYHMQRVGQYRRLFCGRIAIAGRISESNAKVVRRTKADIYVVGSAIVKAKDPRTAAVNIRTALTLPFQG